MTVYDTMLWEWGIESSRLQIINQNKHNPRPRKRMRPRPSYSSASFGNQRDSRLRRVIYHLFTTIGVICLALVFGGMFGILVRHFFTPLP